MVVTFRVDQKICEGCQDWFETVLHPKLSEWAAANPRNGQSRAFRLVVEVDGSQVEVLGAGATGWSAEVGDEPRETPVERLRAKVTEMGLDLGGQRRDALPGDDDSLLKNRREIDQAYIAWREFQESGGATQSAIKTKGEDVAELLEGTGGKSPMFGPRPKGEKPAVVVEADEPVTA